jgi:hypothetical protein
MSVGLRLNIVQSIIDAKNASTYLEIGLARGDTYGRIKCKTKIGVDPVIVKKIYMSPSPGKLIETTSDIFFNNNTDSFDVIFIDGDHNSAQVNKDLQNAIKAINPNGVVLVHDVLMYKPGFCDVFRAWLNFESNPKFKTFIVDDEEFCGVGIIEYNDESNTQNLKTELSKYKIWPTIPHIYRDVGERFLQLTLEDAMREK